MEIESAKCECCGLKEDCTEEYINEVKLKFEGKWLCGLCAEAVRDEVIRSSSSSSSWNKNKQSSSSTCSSSTSILVDDAVKAHKSFCRKFKSNPAVRVADGMRQMLIRRRSGDLLTPPPSLTKSSSSSSSKKYTRSTSTSQVGDNSSYSFY
ncbi:hypothetical protein MKX01_025512 [Papaver californicum]|nr:hypothetical protein MKX01_025512 [Papaver californicum]